MARQYRIFIYTLPGSLMYTDELDLSAEHDYRHKVSLVHYNKGIYVANVISTDGVINRSFKIEKL